MTGTRPPFIYEPVQEDERFPRQSFDPKAVTRASYESKPRKPKRKGPLIAVNRHPEYVSHIPAYVPYLRYNALLCHRWMLTTPKSQRPSGADRADELDDHGIQDKVLDQVV